MSAASPNNPNFDRNPQNSSYNPWASDSKQNYGQPPYSDSNANQTSGSGGPTKETYFVGSGWNRPELNSPQEPFQGFRVVTQDSTMRSAMAKANPATAEQERDLNQLFAGNKEKAELWKKLSSPTIIKRMKDEFKGWIKNKSLDDLDIERKAMLLVLAGAEHQATEISQVDVLDLAEQGQREPVARAILFPLILFSLPIYRAFFLSRSQLFSLTQSVNQLRVIGWSIIVAMGLIEVPARIIRNSAQTKMKVITNKYNITSSNIALRNYYANLLV